MAGKVGSLVFCCWPVSPVGNALPSSFLSRKVEILLFIQIVTAMQPLLKIQHMLRCFCWERTARRSRRNLALSCLTASLLTESGMLKDFTRSRVAGLSFMLWWICWVLIIIIVLIGSFAILILHSLLLLKLVIVTSWESVTPKYAQLDFTTVSFILLCFCFRKVWKKDIDFISFIF